MKGGMLRIGVFNKRSDKAQKKKLKQSEFKAIGRYTIVDRRQKIITCYTDKEELICQDNLYLWRPHAIIVAEKR